MDCIIIDGIRNGNPLEEFVNKSSSLNLIGTYDNPYSALNHISINNDIELIFIDLDTLEVNIFDSIPGLANNSNIILVSSNTQYAARAFDAGVVDYLLKPISYSRFCRAVDKVIRYYSRNYMKNNNNEIFIKKDASLIKLKLSDILYIEAHDNYVSFNTDEKSFAIRFTMKRIEEQLPSAIFMRIHNSYIVNKKKIKAINELSLDVTFRGSLKTLPIGNSFQSYIMKNINILLK